MKSYLKLSNKFETIANINNATGILHWDNAVIMQEGSTNDRARQYSALSQVTHDIYNSTELSDRANIAHSAK